jgi:hypothetical protein
MLWRATITKTCRPPWLPLHCHQSVDLGGVGIVLVPAAFIWAALIVGCCGVEVSKAPLTRHRRAFANARVALGSFAVCCGWVITSTRFLPRWVG